MSFLDAIGSVGFIMSGGFVVDLGVLSVPWGTRRMSGQLSLAGLDASRQPADGLFFAVFPHKDAATDIARLAQHQSRAHGLKGRPLLTTRFHVSLHHLGDFAGLPRGVVAASCEAAAAVVMPPFVVAFDRAMSFSGKSGNQPFVLRGGDGVAGLMVLHQRLGEALRQVGLWRWAKPQYEPHVTLLYDDRCVAEQAIDAISWMVREFVLVHSLHGQRRYVSLGQWPLRG